MDLLGVTQQLSDREHERLLEVRELVQNKIRKQSIEYWNREEFPCT